MKNFDAYTVGPVYASVCSDLSPTETVKRMNREHPAAIGSPWHLSPNEMFADQVTPNPTTCDRQPKTHKHYLLSC